METTGRYSLRCAFIVVKPQMTPSLSLLRLKNNVPLSSLLAPPRLSTMKAPEAKKISLPSSKRRHVYSYRLKASKINKRQTVISVCEQRLSFSIFYFMKNDHAKTLTNIGLCKFRGQVSSLNKRNLAS